MSAVRLIDNVEAPFSGAMNMAIDQTLLESTTNTGRPTLRVYGWKEPTLSLGYFQQFASRKNHSDSRILPLVRRSTGGGAIVHHHDLTYSLCIPGSTGKHGANREIYDLAHLAIIQTLLKFGIQASRYADCPQQQVDSNAFLCFERRTSEDLIVSGYKVAGSAQRRHRGTILQHGSILLATSRFARSLPGAGCVTGRLLSASELKPVLIDRLSSLLQLNADQSELSDTELLASNSLSQTKFASDIWSHKR